MPRLCGFYPGICLTTEEEAWKNLNQGSHTETCDLGISKWLLYLPPSFPLISTNFITWYIYVLCDSILASKLQPADIYNGDTLFSARYGLKGLRFRLVLIVIELNSAVW